ncbi:hypothetical protein [Priestia megaterium]|uniref:hypothetical protein n=1 Tax=Priestia megaterium TaxID=1404 RepID=UPI002E1A5CDA|nr:hypothetical protein [Priestia megaterium]
MIYFISAGLIILGIVIIFFSIWLSKDREDNEEIQGKRGTFLFSLDFITLILGASNIPLSLGLIFLGVLLLIYH